MKKKLLDGLPSGTATSMTNSEVPAGTVVTNGTVTTVPPCALVTLADAIASIVRVPPGNAPPLCV
jgi:hypothetical protein